MHQYYFTPKSHYSTPSEILRKSIPRWGDFHYRWVVQFNEICWFDKSDLGNDAEDWNFKICGITKASTANNADSCLFAGRPHLKERGKFEITWYINYKDRSFDWGPSHIVGLDEVVLEMKRTGDKVELFIDSNLIGTWKYGGCYRMVGPSFGGNRKPPHKMMLYVDWDIIF